MSGNHNQQIVKYVRLTDSPSVLEVKGIDTFEGQTVYMLETEKGLIEPHCEQLVERKFRNYAEVARYLYPPGFIHDTIHNALDLIQDLRDANLEIDVESIKKYLNKKVSNDFIDCVIRFEAEIQAIVTKKIVWEPEMPQSNAAERDAPLGRYQIATGAIQHPDTRLWQVWLSTNGFDFNQLAAFNEEGKALNAVSLIKLEAQSGTFRDEELVRDFYLFLKEQSDGKTLPLPDDLVRKLGRDIVHAVIDMPQVEKSCEL